MTIGFYIHHTTISAGGIFTYTIGILKEILKSKEVEKVIIVTSSEVNDKISEILSDSKLQVVSINRNDPAVKVKLFIYFLLLTYSILLRKIIPLKKLTELINIFNKLNPYTKVLLEMDLSVFHVPVQYSPVYGLELTEYRFNTRKNQHFFCRHFGVRAFGVGNDTPVGKMYGVNVGCLEDVTDEELSRLSISCVDGRNDRWQSAPEYSGHL